jgi:hypothetical protein
MSSIAEQARVAVETLDRDGWCQQYLTYPGAPNPYCGTQTGPAARWADGSHCLLGLAPGEALRDALAGQVGGAGGRDRRINDWNNRPERTVAEVRSLLAGLAVPVR